MSEQDKKQEQEQQEDHLIWFNVYRGAAGNAALFEIRARMVAECVPALAPQARAGSLSQLRAHLIDRLNPAPEQKKELEEAFDLRDQLLAPDYGSVPLVEWLQNTVKAEPTQKSAEVFTAGIKCLDLLLKSQSH